MMPAPRDGLNPPGPNRRVFLQQALAAAAVGAVAPGGSARGASLGPTLAEEAATFLDSYVRGLLPLYTAGSEAAWAALTDVSEAHTATQIERGQAVNEFVGAPRVIDAVRTFLSDENRPKLDDLTVRQLEKVRLHAAEAPGTIPDGGQGADRGRGEAVRRSGWVHLHLAAPRQAGRAPVGQRPRPRPDRGARPRRASDGSGKRRSRSVVRSGTGSSEAQRPPEPGRPFGWVRLVLRLAGRRLRDDRRPDGRHLRRGLGPAPPALRPAPHLGQAHLGRSIRRPGP